MIFPSPQPAANVPAMVQVQLPEVVTTDAAPVFQPWGRLVADGDAFFVKARVWGVRDDGTEGAYELREGFVARAGGTTFEHHVAAVGPGGYTGAPPPAGGSPAGWLYNPTAVTGDQVAAEVQGLAGVTIRWRTQLEVFAIGQARLL